MNEATEEICRKLRNTVKEFGQDRVNGAVIMGPDDLGEQISGHQYVVTKSKCEVILGNVDFKVARFFEDDIII